MKRILSSPNVGVVKKACSYKRRTSLATKVFRELATKENKTFDFTTNTDTFPASPDVNTVNQIAEGDDYLNRDGRKIFMKYLQYDCAVWCNSESATGNYPYSWYLVLDKQANGTAAAFTDIFDTTTIPATYAFKNTKDYQDRFVILKKVKGIVGEAMEDARDRMTGSIPLNSVASYAATTAAVPTSGAIYAIFVSPSGANANLNYILNTRLVFHDS